MKLIRIVFLAALLFLSYLFFYVNPESFLRVPFFTFVVLGVVLILIEYLSSKINTIYFSSFLFAFLIATLFSLAIAHIISFLNFKIDSGVVLAFSFIFLFYLCFIVAFKLSETKLMAVSRGKNDLVVVDTSAIIDGRIADLCSTRFLSARFLIPKFVLRELQMVADSHDHLKRTRGRRGLDVLNKMRKSKIEIVVDEHDFPEIKEVDTKLIQLAKFYNASILTTDYNLNKIAQLQGVVVLNINDLANALKPVVLPGEAMKIRVVKEGKEHNQAIGYLDDGTMVVVENAKHLLGNFLDVVVTSVLQTSAGRIIFTKKSKN